MKKYYWIILLTTIFVSKGYAQKEDAYQKAEVWADSVMRTLSLEERIGQLFIIRAHSNKTKAYHDKVGKLVGKYQVGGVCFFQGNPQKQAELTNMYQQSSNVPLFVAMDAEWGLGMRLKNTISYPKQMSLGALENDTLIYEMGKQIGQQCRRVGVNLNFAPVVDVNSNPKNPVINVRSFGESPQKVTEKAEMFIAGMKSEHVMSCLKHFPGHGDTDADSHLTLPTVSRERSALDSLELYPYKSLKDKDIPMIMVGHLFVPSFYKEEQLPSSLSYEILTDYLRKELKYKGLVITDALEMKGIVDFVKADEIEVKALNAGVDILLMPLDLEQSVKNILKGIKNQQLTVEQITEKVRRVLIHKYLYDIYKHSRIEEKQLVSDIHPQTSNGLINQIATNAITVIKNEDDLIPIQQLDKNKVISIAFGSSEKTDFQQMLSFYDDVQCMQLKKSVKKKALKTVINAVKKSDIQIISLHNTSPISSKNFGLTKKQISAIKKLAHLKPTVLVVFGVPYLLDKLGDLSDFNSIIIAYEGKQVFQTAAAQAVYGGIAAKGQLPVSVNADYPIGTGIKTAKCRLGFKHYSQLGITEDFIRKIDSVATDGITIKAYPGCQIVMVKDGDIFYDKSFGYHTYKRKNRVKNNDVYDVASITKMAATAMTLMKLNGENQFNLDYYLSDYLPYLKNTNKSDLLIRDVLSHQAGFQAWIPYYANTLNGKKYKKGIYSHKFSNKYSIPVAHKLYMNKAYRKTIFDTIITSPLLSEKQYLYSDLGFYLLCDAIERITKTTLDKYVEEQFYAPLGMQNTTYLPKKKINKKRIVPTENDRKFRKQLLVGDVHDQGAAMLGGVSGHAGLFANAENLAVLMQVLLNGGSYGKQQFLSPIVIDEFTKEQYPLEENRRGLVFDRPEYDKHGVSGPACEGVSDESFGHSGFTGTYAWADPVNQTIYIFLSNRIHPKANNSKIMKKDIRTKIHQLMYDALNNR